MTSPTPWSGPPDEDFWRLDPRLQGIETKVVALGIPDKDGKRQYWDLHGPGSGANGVQLAPQASGLMHAPFTQLISEGPYRVGGVHERTDWDKREIGIKVNVGVGGIDTSFRYRMIEERWWASWSATEDSYLGIYTRTHGWRWLRVRLAEEPNNPFVLDPTAFDNNFMDWDMTLVAVQPYWCKRIETNTWVNKGTPGNPPPQTPWDQLEELIERMAKGLIPGYKKITPNVHVGQASLVAPNRGTEPVFPKFLISSPGQAWIEDGPGGRMVPLPLLTPNDGTILLDTDPTARTIMAETDPVDPLFYQIARNSQLLDFFLHDLLNSPLPVWRRRDDVRFEIPWPARTLNRIKVWHSNPEGSVTVLMPQRFGMAYA